MYVSGTRILEQLRFWNNVYSVMLLHCPSGLHESPVTLRVIIKPSLARLILASTIARP